MRPAAGMEEARGRDVRGPVQAGDHMARCAEVVAGEEEQM